MNQLDLMVVGAGPAGCSTAIRAAQLGLKVLLLERSAFPRDKVCGDCLTPRIWPYFETLAVAERISALPSVALKSVRFEDTRCRSQEIPLPQHGRGEVAIRRSLLDQALMEAAVAVGVAVKTECAVETVSPRWKLSTSKGVFEAPTLIAADGRNSTVARLSGILPGAKRDRLAVQTHLPMLPGWEETVGLLLRPEGYCGVAPVDSETLNLCLVSTKSKIQALKTWADERFQIPKVTEWRSIAPLARNPVHKFPPRMLGVGDVGRVVEPFTGEGITYAVASGIAAAEALVSEPQWPDIAARFRFDADALYLGRLWLNRLTRHAVEHPWLGDQMLALGRIHPPMLQMLTAKITSPS